MVAVPSFLLRRLYVRGSLRNAGENIEFILRNTLGAGYAEGMLPLTLDGTAVPLERCFFRMGGEERRFDQVTPEQPFTLALNRDLTVVVTQATLAEGAHKVGMGFRVPGLGALKFDFSDAPIPSLETPA